MAGGKFFLLLDDIVTLLDDVAVLTKVAAKKTAGVLGDDLALNAQQVSGVNVDRELPVVWAVAKGSMLNKVILVPSALILSAISPLIIKILLVIGGLYLCFEGVEKVFAKWLHSADGTDAHHESLLEAVNDDNVDIVEFEKAKIKGAIQTDFILSAEIIVIALASMSEASMQLQIAALVVVSILMTVGVYGTVALIVKMDDAGVYLIAKQTQSFISKVGAAIGRFLLWFAPKLLKTLTVLGTIAMFLVGGGIVSHNIPTVHHIAEQFKHAVMGTAHNGLLSGSLDMVFNLIVGVIGGWLVVFLVKGFFAIKDRIKQ